MHKKEVFLANLIKRLSKKYAGKCVAVIKDKVVAVGRDRIEAYEKARIKYSRGGMGLYYIPTKKDALTALWNFLILK